TKFAFTGTSAISFSDVDAGSNTLGVDVRVTGGTVTLPGFGAFRSVFINAPLGYLNGLIADLVFTPTPDFSGPASIDITITDHGHNAVGGEKIDHRVITIDVTPVNDAPAISGLQDVTVAEGQLGALIDTFTVS